MSISKQGAFSLLDLLFTLTILGILLAIAGPSFTSLIRLNQQSSAVDQLTVALHYARSLAIHRKTMVSICSGDAECAGSTQWKGQMLIFSDPSRDGRLDADEDLHQSQTLPEGYSWRWSNFRNQPHMSFKPDGTTNSLNGTFTLCYLNEPLKQIVINITGRSRSAAPSNNARCT